MKCFARVSRYSIRVQLLVLSPTLPIFIGGLAERSNAAVLKTVGRDERPVGSNPTASAFVLLFNIINLCQI